MRWIEVNLKKQNPKLAQLKPGLFIIDINSEEDRIDALCRNWTFFHRFPVVMRNRHADMDCDNISAMDDYPVWIHFPGLKPRLWTPKILSKVASYAGTPMAMDKMTSNRTRFDFARALVRVKT